MKLYKLNSVVEDKATGVKGSPTHLVYDCDGRPSYIFQPKLLDPEDGHPVPHYHLEPSRAIGSESDLMEYNPPLEVIGTEVTEKNTGFAGMAVGLVLHVDGCVHVVIQARGVVAKNNHVIKRRDVSILRLEGPAIPVLNEQQKDEVRQKTPSPDPVSLDSFHSPGR